MKEDIKDLVKVFGFGAFAVLALGALVALYLGAYAIGEGAKEKVAKEVLGRPTTKEVLELQERVKVLEARLDGGRPVGW